MTEHTRIVSYSKVFIPYDELDSSRQNPCILSSASGKLREGFPISAFPLIVGSLTIRHKVSLIVYFREPKN